MNVPALDPKQWLRPEIDLELKIAGLARGERKIWRRFVNGSGVFSGSDDERAVTCRRPE